MTVKAKTMYYARCDAPGCKKRTSDYDDGDNRVYNSREKLRKRFTNTQYEGGLEDWGWLRVAEHAENSTKPVEKHYCGEHTTWDEESDTRIPKLEKPHITESENA
jgi:hypothetical protein